MEALLVERLEGQHPRKHRRHVLEPLNRQRVADLSEQAGSEPGSEQHEHRDPVRGRAEKDRAEQRDRRDHDHGEYQPDPGTDAMVRPPRARDPGYEHRGGVDERHVDRADSHRAGEAAYQQTGPADRPDYERLEEPALGIAAHRSEREEDGQNGSQEQGGEHRQAEQRGAGEHAIVDLVVGGERLDLVESDRATERVEAEEADREQQHHQDDPAAHRLAQRVARHDQRATHAAPTASRYASSSVEARTRTPYTRPPLATRFATICGTSSRFASGKVRMPPAVSTSTPRGRASSA